MALTPDQIDDFVNLTLKLFKRRQWTDFSLEHQFYTSAKMLQEKKVVERGGEQISFRIKTRNTGNCLLYTSPSPRDLSTSRMPSSA